jgi:hypothetical protein
MTNDENSLSMNKINNNSKEEKIFTNEISFEKRFFVLSKE